MQANFLMYLYEGKVLCMSMRLYVKVYCFYVYERTHRNLEEDRPGGVVGKINKHH